jgi:hypothetical protein
MFLGYPIRRHISHSSIDVIEPTTGSATGHPLKISYSSTGAYFLIASIRGEYRLPVRECVPST